ncbi:MAG: hypothetical protein C0404_06890 [Verrucomicrobia bacterium]|nr:hypothetical protein [Verrucomicrobiota bacterium]
MKAGIDSKKQNINDTADRLMKKGFEALESSDTDRAIDIGRELKNLRHSSAFEILALAHEQKGHVKRAIRILEEGVRRAPRVWVLWQLLGNYYSNMERFANAQQCYLKALDCPHADTSSIHFNAAIAFFRAKKTALCLKQISSIRSKEMALKALGVQIKALVRLGRIKAAEQLAKRALSTRWKDEDQEDIANALAGVAGLRLKQGKTADALNIARKSIGFNKLDTDAAWVIRELAAKSSIHGKYYRIMVNGAWPRTADGNSRQLGFFTNYDVVADDLDEALELLKEFEPKDVWSSLRIESSEFIEKRINEPKGVYKAGGYFVYPKRKSRSQRR